MIIPEKHLPFVFITVANFIATLEAVTVSPCQPTNKIAPQRRIYFEDTPQPRTFGGAFYDLLAPNNNQQYRPPGSLSEEPQKDDVDDCGDIEDYDENDLSSLISPLRRQSRLFFGGSQQHRPPQQNHQRPPLGQYGQYPQGGPDQYPQGPGQHPQDPGQYPQGPDQFGQWQYGINGPQSGTNQGTRPPFRPTRPNYPPTRPPYNSGGYFGSNNYRPPSQQYPSNNVKPVHEAPSYDEAQTTYRPDVVGGPVGHVVGVRPTTRPFATTSSYFNYPTRPTPTRPGYDYPRPERPRGLNYSNSVIGSFFDLLFK